LSLEALHETEIDVAVAPVADRPGGALGGVVSAHAVVVAVSVAGSERPPRTSTASTPRVYVVPHASPVTVDVVLVVEAMRVPLR
jgi:hypothetical protein